MLIHSESGVKAMLVIEKLQSEVEKLPGERQREVLDFVEFLLAKAEQDAARQEEIEWANAALVYTMQRMDEEEGEDAPINSLHDLKELYRTDRGRRHLITNTIQALDQIAINSQVRNGRPFIVGTTITVADIAVAKVFTMMEAEEIADHYRLTLPQVYSALAFYYDHKAEIDQSIEDRRRLADEMKENRVGSRHSSLFG